MAMIDSLTNRIKNQNEYSIAKSITLLENKSSDLSTALRKEIYKSSHKTYVLGITGSPGAGKSTLISSLVNQFDSQKKIGVVSIDPSNKENGGALLGDRIRMSNLFTQSNVFIRSMSNRGKFGGLNKSIYDVVQLFSFAEYDLVIIETIGVGQNEIDISEIADTVMVVSAPESGDSIQVLKAGLMEIADIYIINKSDLTGSEKMEYILKENIKPKSLWIPRIIKIQANIGKNLTNLLGLINEHKEFLIQNNIMFSRRKLMLQKNIQESVIEEITQKYIIPKVQSKEFGCTINNIISGNSSYDETVGKIISTIEKEMKNEN